MRLGFSEKRRRRLHNAPQRRKQNDDEKAGRHTTHPDVGRVDGNGKTVPAGECTIEVDVNGLTVLSISSGGQHTYALPIADKSSNASKKTALVFHHYGNRYYLTAIKHEGGTGYQLPASKLERELQARNVPLQVITLLASAK